MTSRFGKTYSRKAGDGSSKFDEVLSNKRATLSTKWGETTYKAQLGSKRPGLKVDQADRTKRPKLIEDDGSEDPFGFDSDEESKPVTSRNVAQSKVSSVRPTSTETSRASLTLEPNSRVSQPASVEAVAPSRTSSALSGDRSAHRVPEDAGRFFSSSTGGKTYSWSSENMDRHSYSWYKNASESDRRPLAQTTTLKSEKSEDKDTFDAWSAVVGLGARSTSPLPVSRDLPSSTWTSGGYGRSSHLHSKPPAETHIEEVGQGDSEVPVEPSESEDHSQSLLRASNCRTYCRSNKGKQLGGADGFGSAFDSSSEASLKSSSGDSAGKTAVRSRTRDYTVLHPSSVSVCNVTIQDSMDRGMEEFTASASAADPGEAGRLRKKVETETKPVRFRPTQSKSKKDSKLELFGFDDGETLAEEGDLASSGRSNYKIKYFGFDDLSESDSDEEESSAERRRAKRKAMAAAAPEEVSIETSVDSPQPRLSQESQSSSTGQRLGLKRDPLEAPEANSRTMSEALKKPQVKPQEKVKESRKIFSGPKRSPTKAVYNARHWNQPEAEELPLPPPSASQATPAGSSGGSKESNLHKGDEGVFKTPPLPPKVIKSVTIPTQPYQDIVTALKCRKEHKELYTVVQHVKHFNDVVEFGENQEFTDDFEYLATGLKSGQPLNTRCLSIISLATRCALPSFRMHLRARGKVAQVFKTLNDAPQHPNLALCAASLMYILSRDRLNMDLDRASLELMIRLLEMEQDKSADSQLTAKEMNKVKEKIRKLCETVHNKHLDLENITTGHLAMETLLSLTSKRAGDWFKEELRLLGGLDHIVDKVKECVENLSREDDKENLVASLWGAERCLRVLESVTVHNPENQAYLIAYKDSQLIVSSAKALRHCEEMIQRYSREVSMSSCGTPLPYCSNSSVGKAVEDCMRAVIGVLLNLTHDNEWGSTKTGEQEDLIITALNCVLKVPQYLPQEQRFDIRVLGLGLLINLVEYSARNRHCLVEMEMDDGEVWESMCVSNQEELNTEGSHSAIAALVKLFLQREHAAVLAETETDDFINDVPKTNLDQSGEWQETSSGEIQWVASENNPTDDQKKKEDDEEELDLNKALQHAGKHMEDSIVASYTALLLGCLCQGSPMNVSTVRENLPKGDFSIMTEMLKKFLNFMNLTCDIGTTGQKSISRVIDYLEHC
ncbi:wings apart-like protein homolog isoform X2 [Colossoma macropomum]|uniref:wings apart-like protein homolog isoform X2 n=1 Tax=Colossoma macropomum TaxID=42526 RepID=UPI00186521AD|nr:wings apart-like protein homolog isoform X2 [Colossoma macropomum]